MPTAFIADNDMIALGAMRALQRNGYRIQRYFGDWLMILVFAGSFYNSPRYGVYKKKLGRSGSAGANRPDAESRAGERPKTTTLVEADNPEQRGRSQKRCHLTPIATEVAK